MKWQTRCLGEVADLALGKMLDEKKNRGTLQPYLANLNVRWGEFELENLRQMRFEEHEQERYGLKRGDIVMCEGGEPGRCALWKDAVPGMMIQKALHRIRPFHGLDGVFLFYVFLHMGKVGGFAGLFTGSTIKHLPLQNLAKLEVRFPQPRFQERIAAILTTYDDLIENNRRRMALLEQAARQLYDEWFVRLRFPGHERIRVVNGVPEHWHQLPIREVCIEDGGIQTGPFGSQLHQADYTDEGVPVVMPKDLAKYPIDTSSIARIPEDLADRLGRHRMEVGDVVYGRRGDIGRRGYITQRQAGWFCGTGCLRLRPDRSKIVPRYFFDALGAPDTAGTIAARAQGVTMPNLNTTILGSAPILVPPLNLQQTYVDEIDLIFEMIETLDAQSTKLVQARDLLLPRLMSGEIEV